MTKRLFDDMYDGSDANSPGAIMHSTNNFPFRIDGVAIAEDDELTPAFIPPPTVPLTTEDVLRSLQITPEQSYAIANIPQGSQEWLDVRKNRITASNFGAAIGMNKYKSPRGLLKDLLWNTFRGNAATRWGTEHEDVARDAYVAYIRNEINTGRSNYTSIRVEETGLYVNPSFPWMGSSPDGVVHVTQRDGTSLKFLLEIKCPFGKKFYDPPVPSYYNCQIQGVMANMGLPFCHFVVWTPTGFQITYVNFDKEFWDTQLLPGLQHFYFNDYLPLVVAKHNNELEEGAIEVELRL